MGSNQEDGEDASGEFTIETATALVAQLYYDRADIARISEPAASAMDVVIKLVKDAINSRLWPLTHQRN